MALDIYFFSELQIINESFCQSELVEDVFFGLPYSV